MIGADLDTALGAALSCAGREAVAGHLMRFAADTTFHALLGLILGVMVLLRDHELRWAQLAVALILFKDVITAEIHSSWSVMTVIGTAWNVASFVVAFLYLWWALMAPGRQS